MRPHASPYLALKSWRFVTDIKNDPLNDPDSCTLGQIQCRPLQKKMAKLSKVHDDRHSNILAIKGISEG